MRDGKGRKDERRMEAQEGVRGRGGA